MIEVCDLKSKLGSDCNNNNDWAHLQESFNVSKILCCLRTQLSCVGTLN